MSDKRLDNYPDVPTAIENGVDWTMVGFRGLAVPQGTSQPAVKRLREACQKIVDSPEFSAFMEKTGFRVERRDAEAFEAFLAEEDRKWTEVVQQSGLAQERG
jgi:tripartite-type tricarboxylate transporter receptor subunit TctC